MELGEKIRQARLEAGLSQRQLCGETITRNMLSLIENGSAKPSMGTLRFLAEQLGKPVSFFLEEDALVSPNQALMQQARTFFDNADYALCAQVLSHYQAPDPIFDQETALLQALTWQHLAEEAAGQNKKPYALELLKKIQINSIYCREYLLRRKLLLLGELGEETVSSRLPSLDRELTLRAQEALKTSQPNRAGQLLDAVEDHSTPEWNLLRGKIWLAQKSYPAAATCLHRAETAYPQETAGLLELCYRELEDYKKAYEYACKQKITG